VDSQSPRITDRLALSVQEAARAIGMSERRFDWKDPGVWLYLVPLRPTRWVTLWWSCRGRGGRAQGLHLARDPESFPSAKCLGLSWSNEHVGRLGAYGGLLGPLPALDALRHARNPGCSPRRLYTALPNADKPMPGPVRPAGMEDCGPLNAALLGAVGTSAGRAVVRLDPAGESPDCTGGAP
jgi:hypothetical protein